MWSYSGVTVDQPENESTEGIIAMKDYAKEMLEDSRPQRSAKECVDYCLEQLYNDKRRKTTDVCAGERIFEEVIGALLAARDVIERSEVSYV